MKTIAATTINEVVTPLEPMPSDAKLIVFNGTEYVIYEDGDERSICAIAVAGRSGSGNCSAKLAGECAFNLVALGAFWYKAALFCRGPVLALSGTAGKTLEIRGAERQD